MPEDPKRINFESIKKEGVEMPDFGFDRKKEDISSPEKQVEKKEVSTENIPLPQEKLGEAQQTGQSQKSSGIENIENILEEDLGDMYFNLTPEKQREFKQKGEETAKEISGVLQKTKVKVKKIIELIKNWLKVIPGINKFFLEQEAKIKADKILDLKKDN